MKAAKTWILLADGALARVYETRRGDKAFVAVKGAEFEAAHLASRDIDADKPGRSFDRVGYGQHRMQPRTDPHRHAKAEFARHLADFLEQARQRKDYDDLIIAAPAKTLGDLRAALTPAVKKLLRAELDKDLVHINEPELPQHFDAVLHP